MPSWCLSWSISASPQSAFNCWTPPASGCSHVHSWWVGTVLSKPLMSCQTLTSPPVIGTVCTTDELEASYHLVPSFIPSKQPGLACDWQDCRQWDDLDTVAPSRELEMPTHSKHSKWANCPAMFGNCAHMWWNLDEKQQLHCGAYCFSPDIQSLNRAVVNHVYTSEHLWAMKPLRGSWGSCELDSLKTSLQGTSSMSPK